MQRERLIRTLLVVSILGIVAPVTSSCTGCSTASTQSNVVAAAKKKSNSCTDRTSGNGIQSCSPSAQEENAFGKIAVQQAGPQKPVAWGVYPKSSYGEMTIQIQIDGVNVLGPMTKGYPQHGSFTTKTNQLATGATFYISGEWTPAADPDNEQGFYFTCLLG